MVFQSSAPSSGLVRIVHGNLADDAYIMSSLYAPKGVIKSNLGILSDYSVDRMSQSDVTIGEEPGMAKAIPERQ
ncbi:hypothetical protein GCM10009425_22390 [Pseudomonas asuensis]|uniref:Uncharacterized protein n=1 Tax=Pseudomonas asuensis TaxID=1825787 RepID=A0ABQ2GTI5_9PSED|nr:hypothetical protein GCM10009425_22390 [Pseudomonas asuensis]